MPKYVIKKGKSYWPSNELKKTAWITDPSIYKKAEKNPIKFWENLAKEGIKWEKLWKKTYDEKLPYFKWFKGGKLNFSVNALDRHLENGSKNALIWIPEPLNEKPIKFTYDELHEKVNKCANMLKKLGVKKGDVVSIYLPLVPELVISMLACTRLGAIHTIVFSAFAPNALQARIQDGESKILITADGYYRKGKEQTLLDKAKQAIKSTKVKKIIVVQRLNKKIKLSKPYYSFNEELEKCADYCIPEIMNSEDNLFILYTSGTTGKPKGIVHDTGGYAVQSYYTAKWVFNLHKDDVMWCTADIGWITGHTYAVYGPLLNGCTTLIYEGTPDFPDYDRWFKIIDENKVSVFYTAPTALRMLKKYANTFASKHKLSTLKMLGTVGEPIDEETWNWYFKTLGKSRCPIIDTWWQTETGGTLINVLPGIGPFIPTIAGKSFPGTRHEILDEKGKKSPKGNLVQLSPFAPGMLHGVLNNHKKYVDTYWSRFKKKYDTSDGAIYVNNLFRITGRTDDVMKVAGHRISTAEIENAIGGHKLVNESAVVPIPDKMRGEVPVAFVVLRKGTPTENLESEIKKHVDDTVGPIARPSKTYFVNDLPKTRSGKIMRRILKNILKNEEPEGLMTLVNPDCVDDIKKAVKEAQVKK
ncbi:acetate--CoA ligase [Candidatus Pacearchaeota archaeon]|nr:acetate--CoA ligase [Candidatus Pacearchaeota archaeon]